MRRRLAAVILLTAALAVAGVTGVAEAARGSRHGHHPRSRAARDAFQRYHPCPATGRPSGACPGYVVDHIVPLKRGGADAPANMQWQTKAEAKAKDRRE